MNRPKDAAEPGAAAVLRSPMVVATEMKRFCLNFTFNLEVRLRNKFPKVLFNNEFEQNSS
jgi:hypothetical protein